MILQVIYTYWWSLRFNKLNSFIISWNKVVRRNFIFVTRKIKKSRKLATGHSRSYLVTIGNLGYLKLVNLDMYPKFLEISFVQVVRHSAPVPCEHGFIFFGFGTWPSLLWVVTPPPCLANATTRSGCVKQYTHTYI